MTVTSAITKTAINPSPTTFPTPGGSGGVIIAMRVGRTNSSWTWDTAADWTALTSPSQWNQGELTDWWYADADSADPDFGGSASGANGEYSLITIRVDNAKVGGSLRVDEDGGRSGSSASTEPCDDYTTPPADFVIVGIAGANGETTNVIQWVPDAGTVTDVLNGEPGTAEWYATRMHVAYLEITGQSGTYTTGDVDTGNADTSLLNWGWVAVETESATVALAGTATGVAAASGDVTRNRALAGTATGVAAASAALTPNRKLSGTATGVAAISGTVARFAALTGTATGVAAASGDVTVTGSPTHALAGTATGVGSTSGDVTRSRSLSGTATGVAAASGTVARFAALTGTATGVAAASGAVTRTRSLSGTATGVGSASGSISGGTIVVNHRNIGRPSRGPAGDVRLPNPTGVTPA